MSVLVWAVSHRVFGVILNNKKAHQLVGAVRIVTLIILLTVVNNSCYHLFRKRMWTPMDLLCNLNATTIWNQPFMAVAFERHLLVNKQNKYDDLDNTKCSISITLSTIGNIFEVGWTIIEKSRPEHDPNWTRLCNLRPIGSSWLRQFRWGCGDLPGLPLHEFVKYHTTYNNLYSTLLAFNLICQLKS